MEGLIAMKPSDGLKASWLPTGETWLQAPSHCSDTLRWRGPSSSTSITS